MSVSVVCSSGSEGLFNDSIDDAARPEGEEARRRRKGKVEAREWTRIGMAG
jgi:hypothetical protein